MTFSKELRDEAMEQLAGSTYRQKLRLCADMVDDASRIWCQYEDDASLKILNGHVSYGHRLLKLAIQDRTNPPTGTGGAMPVPEQERKTA